MTAVPVVVMTDNGAVVTEWGGGHVERGAWDV